MAAELDGGWTSAEAGTRRDLRLLVGIFTGLLWVDNLSEHYRGGFRRTSMWGPIIVSPLAVTASLGAAYSSHVAWRRACAALAATQGALALAGFWYHQRAIVRRAGRGWRMYVFHAWHGPPALAPLQYLGFSILGLLSTLPHPLLAPLLRRLSLARWLRLFVALNIPPLWAEISYLHWRGSFQDPFQWAPVVTVPLVGLTSAAAAVSDQPPIRRVYQGLACWLIAQGVAGTLFHVRGTLRQYQGLSAKSLVFKWLSGPPIPAPLQLIGLGVTALLGARTRTRYEATVSGL